LCLAQLIITLIEEGTVAVNTVVLDMGTLGRFGLDQLALLALLMLALVALVVHGVEKVLATYLALEGLPRVVCVSSSFTHVPRVYVNVIELICLYSGHCAAFLSYCC